MTAKPMSASMAKAKKSMLEAIYPELAVSSISRVDQRAFFFTQIRSLLPPNADVLDFGAGRDKWATLEVGYKHRLTHLKGDCKRLVACDVDQGVLENTASDEQIVFDPNQPLPFADASFDLVYSWAVLEHIEHPDRTFAEIHRILKPNGWYCAWTPNRFGYFAVAAQIIPESLHAVVLKKVAAIGASDSRQTKDVFPTFYRANTYNSIAKLSRGLFENNSFYMVGPPAYHAGSKLLARTIDCYNRFVPMFLKPYLMVFLRKR